MARKSRPVRDHVITSISIPRELYEKVRKLAEERNQSISGLFRSITEELLRRKSF